MQPDDENLRLLLISNESDKAAMLRQLMERQGLRGEIRRMDLGKSAVACARHAGPYRGEVPPDVVLLDFEHADRRCVSLANQVAMDSARVSAPVVLLTSPDSEEVLRSGDLEFDESRIFAPTSLGCFVSKMQQHSRRRFLKALGVMAKLGPILVRLPASLLRHDNGESALTA